MYVYKISELLERLNSVKNDGFEYVKVSICEPEDDGPESVYLECIEDFQTSEDEIIDSVVLPDNYIRVQ